MTEPPTSRVLQVYMINEDLKTENVFLFFSEAASKCFFCAHQIVNLLVLYRVE